MPENASQDFACGYEVGWEFVESVLCSKQTFSGFRTVVQARYARFSSPVDFMAVNTFIKWWFCWASAMNIDFRERCFSCGNDIRLLTADGTKLGITLKQASVVPIETSEEEQCHSTTLRRFDRTLITNTIGKENRKCINNSVQLLCDHVLEKINGNNEELPSVTSGVLTALPIEIKSFVWTMVHCTSIHSAEKRAIASFLSLLIKDSSITNIVPTRHMDSTKQMLNSINNLKANEIADDIVNIFVQNAKLFSPELGDLLLISTKLSSNSKPKEYLITFLVYLVKRIDDIREQNIVPSISSEIKKYNPPRDAKTSD